MNLCHKEIVEVQKVYDAGTGTLVSAWIQGAGCWCQVHLQVAWRTRNPSKGLRGFKRFNVGSRGVKSRSLPLSSPQCELLGLLFSIEQTARHTLLGALRDFTRPTRLCSNLLFRQATSPPIRPGLGNHSCHILVSFLKRHPGHPGWMEVILSPSYPWGHRASLKECSLHSQFITFQVWWLTQVSTLNINLIFS